MLTGIFGFVFSVFSFVYMLIKLFSKNSTSYFKKEMGKYYVGNKKS